MIQIDLHLVVVKTDNGARQCIAVLVGELDDQAGFELKLRIEPGAR